MREPSPRCAASHACRTRDIGIGELSYLVQVDRLSDERMGS
jgi:hypothetical protein